MPRHLLRFSALFKSVKEGKPRGQREQGKGGQTASS
jgi:hypothetical protein